MTNNYDKTKLLKVKVGLYRRIGALSIKKTVVKK
jgi:hypothetical protein